MKTPPHNKCKNFNLNISFLMQKKKHSFLMTGSFCWVFGVDEDAVGAIYCYILNEANQIVKKIYSMVSGLMLLEMTPDCDFIASY